MLCRQFATFHTESRTFIRHLDCCSRSSSNVCYAFPTIIIFFHEISPHWWRFVATANLIGPRRTRENQFRLSQQLVIFQLTREGKSYAKKEEEEKFSGNSHRCVARGGPSLSLDDDNGRENVTIRADAELVRLSAFCLRESSGNFLQFHVSIYRIVYWISYDFPFSCRLSPWQSRQLMHIFIFTTHTISLLNDIKGDQVLES